MWLLQPCSTVSQKIYAFLHQPGVLKTLIDHILTNSPEKLIQSGVIWPLPNLLLKKMPLLKLKKRQPTFTKVN